MKCSKTFISFLDKWLPAFAEGHRHYMTVSIGCNRRAASFRIYRRYNSKKPLRKMVYPSPPQRNEALVMIDTTVDVINKLGLHARASGS